MSEDLIAAIDALARIGMTVKIEAGEYGWAMTVIDGDEEIGREIEPQHAPKWLERAGMALVEMRADDRRKVLFGGGEEVDDG